MQANKLKAEIEYRIARMRENMRAIDIQIERTADCGAGCRLDIYYMMRRYEER